MEEGDLFLHLVDVSVHLEQQLRVRLGLVDVFHDVIANQLQVAQALLHRQLLLFRQPDLARNSSQVTLSHWSAG